MFPTPITTPTQIQTFALTQFAAAAQGQSNQDLGPAASQQITAALGNAASTIGQWRIVWGPAVLSMGNPPYSVNLMYVVQNVAQPSQYVIAIAGTNFSSLIDSVIEDLFVFSQLPWAFNQLAVGAKISLGAAIGLLNLQNMRPDAELPGGGSSLVDFLRTIVDQKVHITVAGHSLGGALAPVVALWLADTAQSGLLPWDPQRNATIGVDTFAGPTPGNLAFSLYAGIRFGKRLRPVYNTLDVVPHAWQEFGEPSLSELFSIYAPDIAPKIDLSYAALAVLIGAFQLLAAKGGYTPLPNLAPIPGTYNTAVYQGQKLDAFHKFLLQVGYQHINGYYDAFGYNADWMPKQLKPISLSQDLSNLASNSATAQDFVQALQTRQPKQIQVGGVVVNAPRGPDDPQTARVVSMVQAALAAQAGVSAAQ
ncbi:lipase family protein [Nannocystis punicea]|uniref:Fungal lipase-type domain-containing protein n=1 Tax=Nannocystis punicea TaxID=2995304 RepID=A0ABY7GS49_9BACT|nr:hypothetical protein [Nannocystis poenicansa]WAS89762.1 hypothetical protein O0S08_26515 [Nannocystis poenicansa]